MSQGLELNFAIGTTSITATDPVSGLVDTVSVAVNGNGAPTILAGDTIIMDSDSAFAAARAKVDLIQESTDPNTGQMFLYGTHTDNTGVFEPNVDGYGQHAIRIDYPAWKHTTVTTGFTGSPTSQTIVVGSTAGMVSGSNILNLNPRGTSSEIVAAANWSVVDGTHLAVIAVNSHSAGETVGLSYETDPYFSVSFTAEPLGAYYRFRMHAGKTATGVGIGVVPAFVGDNSNSTYFNPGDLAYSGCKRFALERQGRIYLIFVPDAGGTTGHLEAHSDGINLAKNINTGNTFNPDSVWGGDVEFLMFMRPGTSGDGSTGTGQSLDGVLRVWINGVKLMEYTTLPIGSGGVTGLQFPITMRSALYDFTEYYTHLSAWVPAIQP